jgi:hypothetical protein
LGHRSDAFLSGQIFANHDYSVKVFLFWFLTHSQNPMIREKIFLQIIRNKVADYFVKKGLQNFSQSQFRSSLDKLADDVQLMK